MKKIITALLSILLGVFIVATTAAPARAESAIDQLEVTSKLCKDGKLMVSTTLSGEDLGGEVRQRIAKQAPLGDLRRFEYTITDVQVTAGDKDLSPTVDDTDDAVNVSFDPSAAGDQPVTISYQVSGATWTPESQNDQRQFRWPVVQGFNLGIKSISGSITLITTPPDFECRAGEIATPRNCALWNIDRHSIETPTFQDGPVGPGEIVELSATQPAEVVADTSTISTRWTLDRAFTLNLWTALASLAVLTIGASLLWAWHRRVGRDEVANSDPTIIGEFHPVAEGVSEFRLAANVRPGQIGTVADESVDPVDVTATIIDLAVRGFMRIEQLNVPGGIDWTFTRQEKDTVELHSYEQLLLDAVAPASGEPVIASEIQHAVGPVLHDLQHELYDDVVANGWFDKHPEAARTDSRTIGAALLFAGLVVTGLLAWLTTWGLVGLSIVMIGVASLFVAGEMPRRSAKGSALLAGLHGFSAILAQQRTDVMPKGKELKEISELLPFTIVLGSKDRWINAMVAADPDAEPDPEALDWYHAPADWHLQQLPQSLDALIASIQGHLFGR